MGMIAKVRKVFGFKECAFEKGENKAYSRFAPNIS